MQIKFSPIKSDLQFILTNLEKLDVEHLKKSFSFVYIDLTNMNAAQIYAHVVTSFLLM